MIVDKVHVLRLSVEPERDAPVRPNRDCPFTLSIAGQPMQAKLRQIEVGGRARHVKQAKYLFDAIDELGRKLAPVALLVETLQALVLERADHIEFCIMSRDSIQYCARKSGRG